MTMRHHHLTSARLSLLLILAFAATAAAAPQAASPAKPAPVAVSAGTLGLDGILKPARRLEQRHGVGCRLEAA